MQVVIAEHGDRSRPEVPDIAKDTKRVRPAIDEIPHEPETVLCRIESDRLGELSERGKAALYIADCIGSHECVQTSADDVHSQVARAGRAVGLSGGALS